MHTTTRLVRGHRKRPKRRSRYRDRRPDRSNQPKVAATEPKSPRKPGVDHPPAQPAETCLLSQGKDPAETADLLAASPHLVRHHTLRPTEGTT